jgi:methylated-DNA-[protein]-cysteine S-methyltransferase
MRQHYRIDSPVGGLTLVAALDGLVGVYHEHHDPQPGVVLLGEEWREQGPPDKEHPQAGPEGGGDRLRTSAAGLVLLEAARQLAEYFRGDRQAFELPLLAAGTGFQHRVWARVAAIPYGNTRSYRSIAAALGNPAMGRAVGAAVRANPLSIVVPGHRVVAGNGALAGYAAGIEVKRYLLDLEDGGAE